MYLPTYGPDMILILNAFTMGVSAIGLVPVFRARLRFHKPRVYHQPGGCRITGMTRKKRHSGLSPEVLAVLRTSPNLEPCRKFRRVNAARFVEHLNEGKCEQCLAFFRQLDKESEMIQFLRETRN